MFQLVCCDVTMSLIIFVLFITGFREGGPAMRADLWVWAKIPNSPLCLYPVWTGVTVQPWGAAPMSCLCVCSQLCCCLRSAQASNGCKYSQECGHLMLLGLSPSFHRFTFKQCQKGWRHEAARYCVALCCMFQCFMKWRAPGSLRKGPNIPQVAPDQGRGCVFCTCVSDEGDRRLAGSSSGYERKPLCFINFNAASAKWDGIRI